MKFFFVLKGKPCDGVWKVIFMDRHSVLLEDASCESHLIRRTVDYHEFRDTYQVEVEF